jgi:hypothetical protein
MAPRQPKRKSKMKIFKSTAKTFSALYDIANIIQSGNIIEIKYAIIQAKNNPVFAKVKWQAGFNKFLTMLDNGIPAWNIIKENGNSKLPFYTFSVLPGVTCPGAGKCLEYCYSFKAWRFPDAFFRQAQNTILMRFDLLSIKAAFNAIPDGADFRLYVDGDFSNSNDVSFWFNLLNTRPNIKAYGYSKSFNLILNYKGKYPANYKLNISSDHNSNEDTIAKVKRLSITRGEFITVSIGRKIKSALFGTKPVNDAIRLNYPKKVFPCPGKCGSCTGKGHACGMDAMTGVIIAIPVH